MTNCENKEYDIKSSTVMIGGTAGQSELLEKSEQSERSEQSKKIEYMTVEQFVTALWDGFLNYCEKDAEENGYGTISTDNLLQFGWDNGWLEEQDILWRKRFIERRNVARIVHEFLRIQCHEVDERNIRSAERLTDLYDCKVCANHIAQVYIKGIIEAKEERRFQLLLKISENEADEIIRRMFVGERRTHAKIK